MVVDVVCLAASLVVAAAPEPDWKENLLPEVSCVVCEAPPVPAAGVFGANMLGDGAWKGWNFSGVEIAGAAGFKAKRPLKGLAWLVWDAS